MTETEIAPVVAAPAALAGVAAPPPDLRGRRIHFMGAGGIGVSALMELARARGAIVSGCDSSRAGQVQRLRRLGLPVAVGHDPAHAADCDELVHTAAVPEDHPELARAAVLGKSVQSRMRFLGRLARGARAVCVTGSHGKTTTTWMIAHLLIRAGRDPDVLVGGVVPALDSNVRLRSAKDAESVREFVLEADESDNRLAELLPTIPVVTNIDDDHLEHYGTLDDLEAALARFLASAAASGDARAALVGCGDDPRTRSALEKAARESALPAYAYGFARGRTVRGLRLKLACTAGVSPAPLAGRMPALQGMCSRFDARGPFGLWRDLELPMPGKHNVLNALAALTVAWRLGLKEDDIRQGLASCERVGRRFDIRGLPRDVRVVDDYGHHPTEIAATMRAARDSSQGRLAVLFQPHRYTRTLHLMDDFARCFAAAAPDLLLLLPVYAASESPLAGADHATLAARIREQGYERAEILSKRAQAVQLLAAWARPGDTVLVQGAGDVTLAANELVERLSNFVIE